WTFETQNYVVTARAVVVRILRGDRLIASECSSHDRFRAGAAFGAAVGQQLSGVDIANRDQGAADVVAKELAVTGNHADCDLCRNFSHSRTNVLQRRWEYGPSFSRTV